MSHVTRHTLCFISGNIVRVCSRNCDLGPDEMKLLLRHELVTCDV